MVGGDRIRVVQSLFQGMGGGSIPTSPLQLVVDIIPVQLAAGLNELWHSRLPKTVLFNIRGGFTSHCFGASFDGRYYAVAIWTPPIAANRMTNGRRLLELRRFAIAPDAPKNTASRVLSVMVRIIRKLHPHIIGLVSYQDTQVHTGTIYKASGWKAHSTVASLTNWTTTTRKRNAPQTEAPKIRWELRW